jgi:hypothetical protein
MNKLEKLKEINAILNNVIINLETYIFIENIDIEDSDLNTSMEIN